MPHIVILPHVECHPGGAIIEVKPGTTTCNALLGTNIEVEHVYKKSYVCMTCHMIVRRGFNSLDEAIEKKEDLSDKAWGLKPNSHLFC